MNTHPIPNALVALAQRTDAICAAGRYVRDDGTLVELTADLQRSLDGTRLITPDQWPDLDAKARTRCQRTGRATITVTSESTLAAIHRLVELERLTHVTALNFASARNAGGGYRNGAVAQEETLARSSGLVPTLEHCPLYYQANRHCESLLYTDHAIWSPSVPVFCSDDGTLLDRPHSAGVITMPAPNNGAIRTESDTLAVPTVFRQRIRQVLALAIAMDTQHLILGAWGCGAFGNHPDLVAGYFRDSLDEHEPWRRGLTSITFAIYETSRRRPCLPAFASAMASLSA